MTTTKPEWADEYGGDYEPMVRSWGYDVLDYTEHGSYQGDISALLADGDRRGFVVIGYGSCSGCDELQARTPYSFLNDGEEQDWSGVVELSDELRKSVEWQTAEGLADYLDSLLVDPKGTKWYVYDDDLKAAIVGYVERLRAEVKP